MKDKIYVFVNKKHSIHHIHERGYVESPIRIKSILSKIEELDFIEIKQSKHFDEKHILKVHNKKFYNYLKTLTKSLPENKSLYPYVFPIRNKNKMPIEPSVKVGYYCIDTFTPIHKNALLATIGAIDCGLSGALAIKEEKVKYAYALVRPPGHHAESNSFGGFCYLNTNAISANYLSQFGKVAILDIDYHHGNGQQEIFYKRDDVLTISLHGHPKFAYPYFSGFEDEIGEDAGKGYNYNFALKEKTTIEEYKIKLKLALNKIKRFKPKYLVLALGLDTEKSDPTGTFNFTKKDFYELAQLISSLNLPILIIQEGGYDTRQLGINAKNFLQGIINKKN